jgi:hypothetical protein
MKGYVPLKLRLILNGGRYILEGTFCDLNFVTKFLLVGSIGTVISAGTPYVINLLNNDRKAVTYSKFIQLMTYPINTRYFVYSAKKQKLSHHQMTLR